MAIHTHLYIVVNEEERERAGVNDEEVCKNPSNIATKSAITLQINYRYYFLASTSFGISLLLLLSIFFFFRFALDENILRICCYRNIFYRWIFGRVFRVISFDFENIFAVQPVSTDSYRKHIYIYQRTKRAIVVALQYFLFSFPLLKHIVKILKDFMMCSTLISSKIEFEKKK